MAFNGNRTLYALTRALMTLRCIAHTHTRAQINPETTQKKNMQYRLVEWIIEMQTKRPMSNCNCTSAANEHGQKATFPKMTHGMSLDMATDHS